MKGIIMKTLEECCSEFMNSQEPSYECIAALVAYAYSGQDVVIGLAQVGVKRDFLKQPGAKILLPCHKQGRGLNITKAFVLYAEAAKRGVSVWICGDARAEKLH